MAKTNPAKLKSKPKLDTKAKPETSTKARGKRQEGGFFSKARVACILL